MLGLMQNQPLLISGLITHAERHHGDGEIVSRRVEGDIHRYRWRDVARRARQVANALDAMNLLPGRSKPQFRDASRFATRALGIGILANLRSALTGVADWQHTHEEDRRVGLVHTAGGS